MAKKTNYEKEWPKLRIEWAKEKRDEWTAKLEQDPPLLERRKLEADIAKIKLALRDWEADAGRSIHETI